MLLQLNLPVTRVWILTILVGLFLLIGCAQPPQENVASSPSKDTTVEPTKAMLTETQVAPLEDTTTPTAASEETRTEAAEMQGMKTPVAGTQAAVIAIDISGNPGEYRFAVTVHSPDEGCNRYADWWEVLSPQGSLLYRRVLLHSHVDEQPFTRSGGPVPIEHNSVVLVRVHMHPSGYSSLAMKGSPQGGFEQVELNLEFGADLSEVPPLPEDCAF